AASRLAESFCRSGHEVTRLVARADGEVHSWRTRVISGVWTDSISGRMISRFCPPPIQRRWFRRRAVKVLNDILAEIAPEIINVHNLHQAAQVGWSHEFLRDSLHHAPTVWTLHDAWSFTGACSYPGECQSFTKACTPECPHPTSEFFQAYPEEIHRAWALRQSVFQEAKKLVAVSPSNWLAEQAKTGLWRDHRVEVIANGIDLITFCPMEKELARTRLKIVTTDPVLLVAAHVLSDPRKGGELLRDVFERLNRPLAVITLGQGKFGHLPKNVHLHTLGYLEEQEKIVAAYNAADLLLYPALADNLPNTVVEALACGTPVAAFKVGGLPEMIDPGKTGWLTTDISALGFAGLLERALRELDSGVDFRTPCREAARTRYDITLQAGRYLELFKSLREEQFPS
ncbi:MAG: glycosyltransferase, partial [Planctomycetes bacterium]|nr:glycosyltransferase [Planctomycetota bacterium]